MVYPTSEGGAPRTVKYGMPLRIGATPGITSITRNGSAKAPGTSRISFRGMCVEPSSSRPSPSTVTSVGAGGAAGGACGASCAASVDSGVSWGAGSGAGAGGSKWTFARTRARIGIPLRVAGEKRQRSAAVRAASPNGAVPSRTTTRLTVPSFSISSSSTTTASPDAPSGYGTGLSSSWTGATISVFGASSAAARAGASASVAVKRAASDTLRRFARPLIVACVVLTFASRRGPAQPDGC
jgi:hypothetical protein